MQNTYRTRPVGGIQSTRSISTGIVTGAIGGLAGTIVMDLFGLGVLLVNGGPDTISFSLIGDAAATFASRVGIAIPGGTAPGVLLHYLIGLVLGAMFGAGVCLVGIRMMSRKKGMALGIVFVEAMSIPMLTMAAIVLQMDASRAVMYFGTSFLMHLVFGSVLGLVASYGLRWQRATPDF